jgi:hypothetical protein
MLNKRLYLIITIIRYLFYFTQREFKHLQINTTLASPVPRKFKTEQ